MAISRDQDHFTYKKTDESIYSAEDEVETPIKFSALDILRILGGLVLLYSVCCKLLSGKWFYFGSRSTSVIPDDLLSIPEYWLQRKATPIAFTFDELSKYNGESDSERILLSIKGHIFDVTRGSRFYGKWGAYKKFTGTDCSKLFSYPQWDMSVLGKKCSSDLSDCTATELARVNSWLQFFRKKYPEIGYLRRSEPKLY